METETAHPESPLEFFDQGLDKKLEAQGVPHWQAWLQAGVGKREPKNGAEILARYDDLSTDFADAQEIAERNELGDILKSILQGWMIE